MYRRPAQLGHRAGDAARADDGQPGDHARVHRAGSRASFTSNLINEVRFGYQYLDTTTSAADASSEEIPSIEITELGLVGFNAANNRTAIGLAVNLPQYRINSTYQFINTLSYLKGRHAFKGGVDVRLHRRRELLRADDPRTAGLPDAAAPTSTTSPRRPRINKPLPGGQEIQFYDWTRLLHVRAGRVAREGQPHAEPRPAVRDARQLHCQPVPGQRRHRRGGRRRRALPLRCRVRSATRTTGSRASASTGTRGPEASGILGALTGGDKLVVRGGYARTNDYAFININLNIASASPFVAAINSPNLNNAFAVLPGLVLPGRQPEQPGADDRVGDFRSPSYDQYSFEIQRELVARRRAGASATSARRAATCSRRSTATRASRTRRCA